MKAQQMQPIGFLPGGQSKQVRFGERNCLDWRLGLFDELILNPKAHSERDVNKINCLNICQWTRVLVCFFSKFFTMLEAKYFSANELSLDGVSEALLMNDLIRLLPYLLKFV